MREIQWIIGRSVETLCLVLAGILGYFLVINDPNFPMTSEERRYLWLVFGVVILLSLAGAAMARHVDRTPAAGQPAAGNGDGSPETSPRGATAPSTSTAPLPVRNRIIWGLGLMVAGFVWGRVTAGGRS